MILLLVLYYLNVNQAGDEIELQDQQMELNFRLFEGERSHFSKQG